MSAFDLEKRIAQWRNEMSRAGLRPDVLDELESHLRERAGQLKSSGTSEVDAFRIISVIKTGTGGAHYRFLALSWPMIFFSIMSWLNVGVLLLAYFQLTWGRTRKLFPSKPSMADN